MKDLIKNRADTLQIDKKNWTKVKFGSVAIQQKNAVDRDKTDLTFYVKGEHMGSQDLHLREWGELTDEYLGPAFIRYFEKDDILYGSRRTYLRKVVIAPFEGITSNTTLVIKANEKIIDKRLLPFVMMSEGFTDHSIKNSKGSVNPYINWKDLANYEFLLPPKAEQARLAELLWAMDEVIKKEKGVLERLEKSKKTIIENRIIEFTTSKGYDLLGNIGKWISGGTPSMKNKKFWENGTIPWVTPKDMKSNYIYGTIDNITSEAVIQKKAKIFPKGKIVIVWRSGILQHTLPIARVEKDFTINQDLKVFIPTSNLYEEEFIWIFLNTHSEKIRRQCVKEGTTVQSISSDSFMKYIIPIIELDKQKKIIEEEKALENSQINSLKLLKSSQSLQKSLINQIF